MNDINDFENETECVYKNETYKVRDNGAVLRLPKNDRSRKYDNTWTFGRLDKNTGYMIFSGNVRIHQIIMTAFSGAYDSKRYVVDHIDTNRQNNRLENLRLLTRLENILLNHITCKKLESLTGMSIDDILKDISVLKKYNIPPNLSWMQNVSKEEGLAALRSFKEWAAKPINRNTAGKWQKVGDKWYRSSNQINAVIDREWNSAVSFTVCPVKMNANPLQEYYDNIKLGEIIFNENGEDFICVDYAFKNIHNKDFIFVKCKSVNASDKMFKQIITIEFCNNCYIHIWDKFYPFYEQNEDGIIESPWPWEKRDDWERFYEFYSVD